MALVVLAAVVLAGRDGPGDVVTLPPATAETSPSAFPSAFPSASPDASRRPQPSAEPASQAPLQASPAAPPPVRPRSPEPSATAAPAPRSPQQPAPPPPAPRPSPEPTGARAAFSFDAAYGTDEPYEVVVQYGDSSSCPHARVTHLVSESADEVVVTLEADAQDPGRACTADYRQRLVPVQLQQPLGRRVVVDGSRREQVPVDRSCRRPFAEPPPPKDCEP